MERARREVAMAVAVLAAAAVVGSCEWRSTQMAGPAARVACQLGSAEPGWAVVGPVWVPDPEAATIRFAVVNSDAATPLDLVWDHPTMASTTTVPGTVVDRTERVWNGSGSSGFVAFPAAPWVSLALQTDAGQPATADVSWTMAAVDAAGRDVGFTRCSPYPSPP